MSPGAHLLIAWLSGAELLENTRERRILAIAGVAPDLDGVGIIFDRISGTSNYYFEYHHYLGHSIFAALIIATISSFVARTQRKLVWRLSFIVVHLHILCDVVGSKGPDGYQWPVYYFYPVYPDVGITWKYQWQLNAWPNILIIVVLFGVTMYYARKKRITFLEVFSKRLDEEAFKMYFKYCTKSD